MNIKEKEKMFNTFGIIDIEIDFSVLGNLFITLTDTDNKKEIYIPK